jgi:hypothetical protein
MRCSKKIQQRQTMSDYARRQMFPLRLAPSIREAAGRLAQRDGISLNHFISLAVAEKIARMEQAAAVEQPGDLRPRSSVLRNQFPEGGLRRRYLA